MHADHAAGDGAQQSDRVVARDDGIRRVVLHAEMISIGDHLQQLEEDVHLLGEFGIFPEAVLVVVFQPEHDVVLTGDGKRLIDAFGDPFQPLPSIDFGIALAGENPADRARATQPPRHGDQCRLAIDGALPAVGIGIREVGRAAEHRHREARRGDRVAHLVEIGRFKAREEPVIHFQTVGIKRTGLIDPVEDRHGAIAGDLVDIALWESGDFHHCQLLVVSCDLGGQGLGGGQAVAVGDEIGDFGPVDLADVEAKADPSSRADVGGAVKPRLIRCQEDLVFAAFGLETDGDDAVAVMVVEVVCEFLLPNREDE